MNAFEKYHLTQVCFMSEHVNSACCGEKHPEAKNDNSRDRPRESPATKTLR